MHRKLADTVLPTDRPVEHISFILHSRRQLGEFDLRKFTLNVDRHWKHSIEGEYSRMITDLKGVFLQALKTVGVDNSREPVLRKLLSVMRGRELFLQQVGKRQSLRLDGCIADYLCLVTATTTMLSSIEIQLATEYIANSLPIKSHAEKTTTLRQAPSWVARYITAALSWKQSQPRLRRTVGGSFSQRLVQFIMPSDYRR